MQSPVARPAAVRPKRFPEASACDPDERENLRAETCTGHYARTTVAVPRDAESLSVADRDEDAGAATILA